MRKQTAERRLRTVVRNAVQVARATGLSAQTVADILADIARTELAKAPSKSG